MRREGYAPEDDPRELCGTHPCQHGGGIEPRCTDLMEGRVAPATDGECRSFKEAQSRIVEECLDILQVRTRRPEGQPGGTK